MSTENSASPLSSADTERILLAIAVAQVAYEMNDGIGLIKGDNLRYIENTKSATAPGARPLSVSIPDGFEILGVYKHLSTGLDAYLAFNKDKKDFVVGIAGTNGMGTDQPDTSEDFLRLGLGQSTDLMRNTQFLKDFNTAIDSIGGKQNLNQVLVAGQSLGGGIATIVGMMLMHGDPRASTPEAQLGLQLNGEQIKVVSINGFGAEYSFAMAGFTEQQIADFSSQTKAKRLVTRNKISGEYDLIARLGGYFPGSDLIADVEAAKSVTELHKLNYGVAEYLDTHGNDLSQLRLEKPPQIDHDSLSRNLFWLQDALPIANNLVSITWSSYVAMLFSQPGEGAASLSASLRQFVGVPQPLADVLGAIGELALRWLPIANLSHAVRFLLNGYLLGQALGSSNSPGPSTTPEAIFGVLESGWKRTLLSPLPRRSARSATHDRHR